jgi:hypothetical protein
MTKLCSVIVIVLLAAPAVRAADPPANLRGAVVRLTPNSGERIVGTLSEISDASLSLSSDTGVKVIPRNSIRKLEWRDRDGHPFIGILVLGGISGALGLILKPSTFGTESGGSSTPFCTKRLECAGKLAAGGAVIGTIGALATHTPVWRKVPLSKVSVGIEPAPRGVRAALKMTW